MLVRTPLRSCRVMGCAQGVPPSLAQEVLCLDHYVEQAQTRLKAALELCQQGRPVDPRMLDWLLADADFILQSLAQDNGSYAAPQREKLLELFLCFANLQEYLRHHAVQVKPGD